MRIHISSGPRKRYNPQPGDVKETKEGRFRRVPRLAWGGPRCRHCIGRQVSNGRPLYDWIEEKYFDRFGNHWRSQEWWDEHM